MKIDEKEILLREKRDILAELEYRRTVNPIKYHKLLPMQQRFKDDKALLKCIFGGNRSGKSEGAADDVLSFGLEKEKARIWICGETFQDSIAIQQRKIWNLVPRRRILYGNYDEINGFTNRKLLLDNGTLYTFKSYDQGTKVFQSDDIDLVWNDEEPPADIYKEQRMRLIDRNGRMIISMTSLKGVTELIEEIFEEYDPLETQEAPLIKEVLPRVAEKNGAKFYFLWTTENPHINHERTLLEAELMTRDEKKSRIYGMPINLTGRIYPAVSRDIHVVQSIEDMPEGHYTLYHVLDPHDMKPWAMIWVAVHKTGSAYVIDEYPNRDFFDVIEHKTYAEYGEIIKDKEKYMKEMFGVGVRRRIIDPNFGNKTVQLARRQGGQTSTTPKKELGKLGFVFKDGIDALEAGHMKVREMLHYSRDEESQEIIKQPQLKFLEGCRNTVRSMLRYSRKDPETSSGDIRDKVGPHEKYKDHPDCVRYGAMSNMRFYDDKEFNQTETRKVY